MIACFEDIVMLWWWLMKSVLYSIHHLWPRITKSGLNLFLYYYLFHIIVKNISETFPSAFWHKNWVSIVSLDFRYGHVTSLLILLDVKVEILVLNSEMFILGSIESFLGISCLFKLWEVLVCHQTYRYHTHQ